MTNLTIGIINGVLYQKINELLKNAIRYLTWDDISEQLGLFPKLTMVIYLMSLFSTGEMQRKYFYGQVCELAHYF